VEETRNRGRVLGKRTIVCLYSGRWFVDMFSYHLKYQGDCIIMLWKDFKAEAKWLEEGR